MAQISAKGATVRVGQLPVRGIPWAATAITVLGAVLFILSLGRPWWGLIMYAPQYPSGLETTASLRHMAGDVAEIDTLNHYIGMMSLDAAAKVERAIAPFVVYASAALAVLALAVRRPLLAWLLRIPMLTFPLVFMLDLKFWLWYAGNHLDPRAALSAAIKSFTPIMLGEGKIAQFRTYGWLEPGFWLAVSGVLCVLAAGLLLSWRSRSEEV